jgi:hypothetical protein
MLIYDLNANPLNSNEWAFPLTECFHIASFAFSIGTIALVDLRLLGVVLKRRVAAELLRSTALWTLVGLTVAIVSGLLIFSSDPVLYLRNRPFQYKVTNLMLSIVFNYTVHARVARAALLHDVPQNSRGALGWLLLLAGLYAALPFCFALGPGFSANAALVAAVILVNLVMVLKAPIVGSLAEQKTAGTMSLGMWAMVIYSGLWIAFV